VPEDSFSLDLPFSQGSHAGDSSILQEKLYAPSFSQEAFDRLKPFSKNGYITREQMGEFIAVTVMSDDESTTIGSGTIWRSSLGLFSFLGKSFLSFTFARTSEKKREAAAEFTKILGTDNIAGSAGEWALMYALFTHRTDGRRGDVIYLDEMLEMFRDKKMPEGWENWKRSRGDWAGITFQISKSGYNAFASAKITDATSGIVKTWRNFKSIFSK
jgi:hypothetical protein